MSPARLLMMFNYRDCVARAAEICGGPQSLARRVNAWPEDVVRWSLGVEPPTTGQLVRILELVREGRP